MRKLKCNASIVKFSLSSKLKTWSASNSTWSRSYVMRINLIISTHGCRAVSISRESYAGLLWTFFFVYLIFIVVNKNIWYVVEKIKTNWIELKQQQECLQTPSAATGATPMHRWLHICVCQLFTKCNSLLDEKSSIGLQLMCRFEVLNEKI